MEYEFYRRTSSKFFTGKKAVVIKDYLVNGSTLLSSGEEVTLAGKKKFRLSDSDNPLACSGGLAVIKQDGVEVLGVHPDHIDLIKYPNTLAGHRVISKLANKYKRIKNK